MFVLLAVNFKAVVHFLWNTQKKCCVLWLIFVSIHRVLVKGHKVVWGNNCFSCAPQFRFCPSCFTVCTTRIMKTRHEGCCCTYLTRNDLSKLLILNMSLGNKAGIMQSMSRGNHMISSAIWDKSARVNLEHAEIYAYVFLGLKLLVWFEIRPKLPFEIAKFSHSNTVFFICKNTLLIQYSAGL